MRSDIIQKIVEYENGEVEEGRCTSCLLGTCASSTTATTWFHCLQQKYECVCACVCVCVCLRVGPGTANGGLAAVGEGGHRRMYMHTRAKPWARAGERPGSSLDNRVSEYDR